MASTNGITITWLGHATTLIETPAGKRILIDAWTENNPATPEQWKTIDKLDLMVITHGHFDHLGDAVTIAKATRPDIMAQPEICHYLGSKGVENCTGMNVGGTVEWNGTRITMVDAVHSSGISEGDTMLDGGTAAGYVIRLENSFAVYHSGDTAAFEGMRLIGRLYKPDVAMLPIGGHFTMDPREAAEAVRLLGVTTVIPIHYGTFPVLAGTPEQFQQEAADISGLKVVALKPGESVTQRDLV